MADQIRDSVLIPTLKCSNCGDQVRISMMGDHVCGGGNKSKAPEPPPQESRGGAFSSLKHSVFNKFSRATPTLDTSAANRAFPKYEQLTPISTSMASQAISPKTPLHSRPGAGFSNNDLEPSIAGSPRRPSGYGGFSADSESLEGESTYGTTPNKQTSRLLSRMDNIAPGPFEVSRTHSPRYAAFPRGVGDDTTDLGDETTRLGSSIERPSTAASGSSGTSGGMSFPKMPRKNGYAGFGPPSREGGDAGLQPPAFNKRSETFPDQLPNSVGDTLSIEAPVRPPSAPGPRPERLSPPSDQSGDRLMATGPHPFRSSHVIRDTSRLPPPRTSLIRPSTRDGSMKLSINLADEFGAGNPYHSSSISQSSSNSGYSHESVASDPSSNTSPARSVESRSETRKISDASRIDSLIDDLHNSMNGSQPVASSTGAADSVPHCLKPGAPGGGGGMFQVLQLDSPTLAGPDSPVLPGNVSNSGNTETDEADEGRKRAQTVSSLSSSSHNLQSSQNPRSRGNCKACQEPITGKSIASADGRLTGRYHKACFVCTTCKEAFTSATFYVLDDRPYCEQHYHKLNGSLCGSCRQGIEGQYLEDEVPQKYHPGCFRCGDCDVVLRDGYFDVNGKSYCERDAWRRMQSVVRSQQMGPPPPQQWHGPPPRPGMRGPPPGGFPGNREPPRGPPGNLYRPFGMPAGQRLMPGQALGRGGLDPMHKLEKRMTRLGMM
ncbi:hypothetical protein GGS21DRAFT_215262 [Xylaria nigripes]|nr:hypothetical protein GGS21DRAFT_215262 [Xylaria nigripes]